MSTAAAARGLLARQVRHEVRSISRIPVVLILSVGLPVLFFVLLSALVGNEVVDPSRGVRLVQYLAPGMASFGVAMATFSFLAVGLSEARSTGVLKRQAATPVPRWVLIGGRVGAALGLGLTATALVLVTGVLAYHLQVPARTIPAVLVTLVVASASFSALGLAIALALPTMQLTLAVTSGIVIPLSFVSDMFMVGVTMPPWLAAVGWAFPLKHLAALLSGALDPYATGSGFALDHLGVIALWGLVGAAAAVLLLRRDPDRTERTALGESAGPRDSAGRAGRTAHRSHRTVRADAAPRRAVSPSLPTLVLGQVGHGWQALWRTSSAVFFAVLFPVLLVAIIPTVNGGRDHLVPGGLRLGTFIAGAMAVYGAAVTSYVNMPQAVSEDRERGVLKRMGGTPLPISAFVAGRIVGALTVTLASGLAIAVLAALLYRPAAAPGLPAAAVTLVVASTCFGVVGLAVTSFVGSAQAAVGVALGTLLPLAFVSDIFVVGASYPPVVEWVSWIFPLRHASAAMTEALAPHVTGTGLAWGHLGALLAWTMVAGLVVRRRFTVERSRSAT